MTGVAVVVSAVRVRKHEGTFVAAVMSHEGTFLAAVMVRSHERRARKKSGRERVEMETRKSCGEVGQR